MNKTVELVQALCQLDGVSGAEEHVREYIEAQVRDYCDTRVDARGNLICVKKGRNTPAHKIMLSAHMDEVGFVITSIDDEGFLRFSTTGNIDSRVVIGKTVCLESGVPGVVGTKPIHVQTREEQDTPLKVSDMYLDIGAVSKEDAMKSAALGDHVAFRSRFVEFGNGRIRGKALDNRAGCACLIQLLQQDAEYDFTAVFSVCAECGVSGAGNAAFDIKPDIAIVVNSIACADVCCRDELEQVAVQGQGPCLSYMEGHTIFNRGLIRRGMSIAQAHNIPCQLKYGVSGSSEASGIQCAGSGARVMSVSIPVRYAHSFSNVMKVSDIDSASQLLGCLAEELAR